MPELERMGLLSCVDGAALEGYCNAYANMVEAQRILNERGMTFVTPSGYIAQRPEVGIVNKSLALIRGFLTELGLSPAARARMAVGPTENETDPMEELLRWSPSVAIPAAEDRETNETVRAGD